MKCACNCGQTVEMTKHKLWKKSQGYKNFYIQGHFVRGRGIEIRGVGGYKPPNV